MLQLSFSITDRQKAKIANNFENCTVSTPHFGISDCQTLLQYCPRTSTKRTMSIVWKNLCRTFRSPSHQAAMPTFHVDPQLGWNILHIHGFARARSSSPRSAKHPTKCTSALCHLLCSAPRLTLSYPQSNPLYHKLLTQELPKWRAYLADRVEARGWDRQLFLQGLPTLSKKLSQSHR